MNSNNLSLPSVALEEVSHISDDCCSWLSDNGLTQLQINEEMLQQALIFKALIGVVDERYGNGVDENDLLIIACAKINGYRLISNEAIQNNLPKNIQNCKIPAICGMPPVTVECIDFLEYIKQSDAVF